MVILECHRILLYRSSFLRTIVFLGQHSLESGFCCLGALRSDGPLSLAMFLFARFNCPKFRYNFPGVLSEARYRRSIDFGPFVYRL